MTEDRSEAEPEATLAAEATPAATDATAAAAPAAADSTAAAAPAAADATAAAAPAAADATAAAAPEAGPDAPSARPNRLDELLADPPDMPTVGSLTGYRDGGRLRRRIIAALVVGVVVAIFIGRRYARWLEERQRIPTPEYRLAEGAEGESRPDAIVWTDGPARLGISRQDPGVKAIVLPDRVITLAPGCDHAQIKVDVQNGKTVKLKVLVGEIRETTLAPDSP